MLDVFGFHQYKTLLIIITLTTLSVQTMADEAYKMRSIQINKKQFLNPNYNIFGCEKYMLPKLSNAPVHHTFFQTKDIQQVYKELNVDPQKLNHNLGEQNKEKEMKTQKIMGEQESEELDSRTLEQISEVIEQKDLKADLNKGRQRPKLRSEGYTHFIHIPFVDALTNVYESQIIPKIQQQDRDILMPLSSMHMTVMVFRLKKEDDLKKWSQVLKTVPKKMKAVIRGVDIFPVKKNFSNVLYLNIKGLQDLIDSMVSKAIELELITEQQLSHIKFDKASGTYKSQPHISLLRTKGKDLFDFTQYLKLLKNINVAKINVNEIRLSVIGSHDGEDYYNQEVFQL